MKTQREGLQHLPEPKLRELYTQGPPECPSARSVPPPGQRRDCVGVSRGVRQASTSLQVGPGRLSPSCFPSTFGGLDSESPPYPFSPSYRCTRPASPVMTDPPPEPTPHSSGGTSFPATSHAPSYTHPITQSCTQSARPITHSFAEFLPRLQSQGPLPWWHTRSPAATLPPSPPHPRCSHTRCQTCGPPTPQRCTPAHVHTHTHTHPSRNNIRHAISFA